MSCTLVIDQGTHASRAVICSPSGAFIDQVEEPVDLIRIDHECVEQDPQQILDSIYAAVDKLLARNKVSLGRAALTTQRSTVLAWQKNNGQPLSPALSWQDRRALDDLKQFEQKEREVRRITGLPLSPHYGAGKLRWLLNHNAEVHRAQEANSLRLGPLVSYLLTHLLPNFQHLTDHSNAHRTLLLDIGELTWSEALLDLFEIPRQCLPRILPVKEEWGVLKKYGVPLSVVCGDQNAALYAHGALPEKTAAINVGTGAFVLMPCASAMSESTSLLCSIAKSDADSCDYLMEGTVNGAGSALSWAQQQWPVQELFEKLEGWLLAVQSPPLFINTVSGLGSPWWKSGAEPHFTEQEATVAARYVAIIESVVFLLQHNIDALQQLQAVDQLRISGGLSRLNGLCQRISDLSGLNVIRLQEKEATARGAAWLAVGCPEKWETQVPEVVFQPKESPSLEQRYSRFTKALERL